MNLPDNYFDKHRRSASPRHGGGEGQPIRQLCGRTTARQKTLADLGISKDQLSQWQKLAAVPDEQFEAELAGPEMVGTDTSVRLSARSFHPIPSMTCGLLLVLLRQRLAAPPPYSPPQRLVLWRDSGGLRQHYRVPPRQYRRRKGHARTGGQDGHGRGRGRCRLRRWPMDVCVGDC